MFISTIGLAVLHTRKISIILLHTVTIRIKTLDISLHMVKFDTVQAAAAKFDLLLTIAAVLVIYYQTITIISNIVGKLSGVDDIRLYY